MSSEEVNSKAYWETRFQSDWDAAGGPEQTRFFAETALRLMPAWLVRELKVEGRSFLDVGCAEGEAVAWFKREFPGLAAGGVDFSAAAIDVARERHPGSTFQVADIRAALPGADIVFCSNVLEHFHDPEVILARLAEAARRHLVVVVPGWELQRHHEHHVTFYLDSFPFAQSGLALTHVQAINCGKIDPRQWPGFQLLVVYSTPEAIGESGATAADAVRIGAMTTLSGDDLRDLAVHEDVLRILAGVGGDNAMAASIAAVDVAVQALAQRQESIAYNTRVEVMQAIDGVAAVTKDVLESRSEEWERERQRAETHARHLEDRLGQAEGALAAAHEYRRELESRLVLEVERRATGESERQARSQELDGARRRVEQLEASLQVADRERASEADLRAVAEAGLANAVETLELERHRSEGLEAELRVAELERASAVALRAAAESSLAQAQEALQSARKRADELEERLQVAERKVSSSMGLAERAASELREVGGRLAANIGNVARMRAILNEKDNEMKGVEKAVEDLNIQLGAIVHELARQGHERSTDLAHLRAECAGLRAAISILEEDRARFVELAARYRDHLVAIHTSASWSATAPLRGLKSMLSGSDPAAPIEFLPSPLVVVPTALAPPMDPLPPLRLPALPTYRSAAEGDVEPLGRDLSWEEFNERVLVHRGQYRGVFIQELVIDWNVPLYQRPQHIASAMARIGYLVIYRTGNWGGDDVSGFREIEPNVWLTNFEFTDKIPQAVRSVYSTAYAHTPERLETRADGCVTVYEYIDHIDPQISGEGETIQRLLALKDWAFGGGADIVVASAKVLHDEAVAAVGADRVVLAQNGVDTRHYRNPAQAQIPVPESLHAFRGRFQTVVGYFGAIAPWLWYDAIGELVAKRPDLGFVFIGPDYYNGVARLPQGDNVLYMGTVDYKVLPAHARFFDVCFIPFEPGEIARTTSPLKLFEYFALEKPVVVTTDMLECVAHPEVFRGRGADEFSVAIDQAVAVKDDPAFKRRLAELADQNDWDRRAAAFGRAFELLREKTGG